MYGPYCIVCDHEVLALVEDSFHRGRCSCNVHSQGCSAPSGKEQPCIDVRFSLSPLLYTLDAMTLASELGQKYTTQNYPSQGTPICKLHGPSIKPRKCVFFLMLSTDLGRDHKSKHGNSPSKYPGQNYHNCYPPVFKVSPVPQRLHQFQIPGKNKYCLFSHGLYYTCCQRNFRQNNAGADLSTVRQIRFRVDEYIGAQIRSQVFQILHSRCPNQPSLDRTDLLLNVRDIMPIIMEQNRSTALCK